MDGTITKSSVSIRIDSEILKQLKEEAKKENTSLSDYLEALFRRIGYKAQRSNETVIPELKDKIERAREDYKNGKGTVCRTAEESKVFFESL